MSTTLAITIPYAADAMDKRYRHFRTIFAGLGLVIGDFAEVKPYNKDGRELVMVRFDVRFETAEDGEHRSRYRLDHHGHDERRMDAQAVLERINTFAAAKAEYDAADPASRGDFTLKPLEIVYDSQDHFWKVYKFAPRSAGAAAAAIPRARPKFR
jgi:hypothetical protein